MQNNNQLTTRGNKVYAIKGTSSTQRRTLSTFFGQRVLRLRVRKFAHGVMVAWRGRSCNFACISGIVKVIGTLTQSSVFFLITLNVLLTWSFYSMHRSVIKAFSENLRKAIGLGGGPVWRKRVNWGAGNRFH